MSNIVFDNALLRAALTASDQAYGNTESGFNLQWIDNTGNNASPPFQNIRGQTTTSVMLYR